MIGAFKSIRNSVNAALCFALASLTVPVCGRTQELVSLSGIVTPGPCKQADVITDSNGRRFEIDRSRSVLPSNTNIEVQGRVYPRISVCKVFPWLEVVLLGSRAATQQKLESKIQQGDVTLTVGLQDMAAGTEWLKFLVAQPNVVRVHLLIQDQAAAAQIPQFLNSLGSSAGTIFEKVDVAVEEGTRPRYEFSGSRGKTTFRNIEEVIDAVMRNE